MATTQNLLKKGNEKQKKLFSSSHSLRYIYNYLVVICCKVYKSVLSSTYLEHIRQMIKMYEFIG